MTTGKSLLISLTIGCSLISHAVAAPDIVPAGSKVELVARTQTAQATPFTEGPVYREGYLYFTDTSNSRILRVRVDRQAALPLPLEIFRASSRASSPTLSVPMGLPFLLTRKHSMSWITTPAEEAHGKCMRMPCDQ